MGRRAFLTVLMLPLAACSGLGQFEGDTLTLPGANPTAPAGASETMLRVEHKPSDEPPLTPEQGNVWPGDPKPFPNLREVERETQQAGQGGPSSGSGGSAASPSLPPPPGGASFQMKSNPNAASTIVIPNGNGTSTVIAPDGGVKVIPTPKSASGGSPPGVTAPGTP